MSPPNMFSVIDGQFLASGATNRHCDVSPAVRARILAYCWESLLGSDYPALQFYPDLAVAMPHDVDARQGKVIELSRT